MLNGEFPRNYINVFWEKWLWWSWKACHFWPVTLNPSGPEEIWERNSTLRLAGWKKLEVGDLDVTNRSCGVFIYLSSGLFFLLFFCWFFVSCCFFLRGNERTPWRIMSWWTLIKWLEWMGWEPLKRRKEKVVLVVLQLKTTSYSASLYSKIGHHMFSRSMNIKNMFLQEDGLKKDFSFKYIWCPIPSISSFASLWTLVCLCFHTGHAFLIEIIPTKQRGTILFQVF